MNKMIAVVGMCGSGKSVVCDYLVQNGYQKIYFGGVTMQVLKEEGLEVNPENEKMIRERLRKDYGMGAYAVKLLPQISSAIENGNVVLDGLYSWNEYVILRKHFKENLKMIAVICDKELRYQRLSQREVRPLSLEEAIDRDISEIENIKKGGPIAFSDYFIYNNSDKEECHKQIENILRRL